MEGDFKKGDTVRRIIFLALVLSVSSFSFAQENLAERGSSVRLEVLAGYGFGMSTRFSAADTRTLQPYDLGIGVRAGYIFHNSVYLGGIGIWHRGQSVLVRPVNGNGIAMSPYRQEARIEYAGVEIGYEAKWESLLRICPYLGVGVGEVAGNTDLGSTSSGEYDLKATDATGLRPAISPGVTAIVELPYRLNVGLDVRYTALAWYHRANGVGLFLVFGYAL